MRIILNSDVLYRGEPLGRQLPESHKRLMETCVEQNHVLVLPETVVLELQRRHEDARRKAIEGLQGAYEKLDRFNVPYDRREPSEVIPIPNVVGPFQETGVQLAIEKPTLEDFNDAHRRAALHLSPQPPSREHDEMRDLVIWAIALRLAMRHGAAILISRDEVHAHERADAEANDAGLMRFGDIESALSYLGAEAPAGKLASAILESYREQLVDAGLPLSHDTSPLVKVTRARVVQSRGSVQSFRCQLEFTSADERRVAARLYYEAKTDAASELQLTQVTEAGKPTADLRLEGAIVFPPAQTSKDRALAELRELLGGPK